MAIAYHKLIVEVVVAGGSWIGDEVLGCPQAFGCTEVSIRMKKAFVKEPCLLLRCRLRECCLSYSELLISVE